MMNELHVGSLLRQDMNLLLDLIAPIHGIPTTRVENSRGNESLVIRAFRNTGRAAPVLGRSVVEDPSW
jgi:hypothetical protein